MGLWWSYECLDCQRKPGIVPCYWPSTNTSYKLYNINCFQFSFTWKKCFILHTRDVHLRDTSPTTSGSPLLRVVPHSEETRLYIYFISRRSIENNDCLVKPMRTLHLHVSIYMYQTLGIQTTSMQYCYSIDLDTITRYCYKKH